MKYKGIIALIAFALLMPGFVFAKENNELPNDGEFVVVAETTKYYKTVTTIDLDQFTSIGDMGNALTNGISSVTYEVTEEEYNNAREEDRIVRGNPAVVETTYKRRTSSISANGSYYRYKNVLNWKLIPSVRSYDIIAIGHLGDVTPKSMVTAPPTGVTLLTLLTRWVPSNCSSMISALSFNTSISAMAS